MPRLLRVARRDGSFELDCVPNGAFTRELEPLPEHLGALGPRWCANAARTSAWRSIPMPTARRSWTSRGVPLGEEYTVALGTAVVLEKRAGPVVTNLSTSRILDAVCARSGVPLYRTAVGEAHVVAAMRSRSAVAGGEGNGGMILPAAHYGRDGAGGGGAGRARGSPRRAGRCASWPTNLPAYRMLRTRRAGRGEQPWERSGGAAAGGVRGL